MRARSRLRALASAGVTSFAIEAIPRITRAQAMDALSSQANVAGYAATLLALYVYAARRKQKGN